MKDTEAEIPGLVWGYRIAEGGGRPTPIGPLDRGRLGDRGAFIWLHFALSDARVPGFLERLGLPEPALQTLTGRDHHPVVEADADVLHGVLIDFQRTFDEETSDVGWLRFAVTDSLIVTTRLQPLRSVDRARSIVEQTSRATGPLQVLDVIVLEFLRALHALTVQVNDELNVIEDYVYDDEPRDERRRLAPIRRLIVRLNRHLRGVTASLRRIETLDEDEIDPAQRAFCERIGVRIERVERDVQGLQDRARLLHEDIDSKISAETNRHLYILSVMTAFILPPTLVAGVFGMNTGGLPLHDTPEGTWLALGLCGLSIAFAWWLLRRAGIL